MSNELSDDDYRYPGDRGDVWRDSDGEPWELHLDGMHPALCPTDPAVDPTELAETRGPMVPFEPYIPDRLQFIIDNQRRLRVPEAPAANQIKSIDSWHRTDSFNADQDLVAVFRLFDGRWAAYTDNCEVADAGHRFGPSPAHHYWIISEDREAAITTRLSGLSALRRKRLDRSRAQVLRVERGGRS